MDTNGSPSHKMPPASPTDQQSERSSPATEVPPLVYTDVSSAAAHPSSIIVTPTAANPAGGISSVISILSNNNNGNSGLNTTGAAARRTVGPVLPPLPVPVTARLSPANSSTVTVSTVSAHNSASTPSALFFTTFHPTTAMAAPHVNTNASLATASLSREASGADCSAGGTAEPEPEAEPFLTNGSIALAEFTSLLKPSENTNVLREHIIHLLRDVDTEDTLVRIARTLEAQEGVGGNGGSNSPADVSSTTWIESRTTPTMTNASHSTGASVLLSARHSRRSSAMSRQEAQSFEALAGFSFLHSHRRTASTLQDSPSSQQPSEDSAAHNRSTRGVGGPMEVSFSSQSSHPTHGADSRRTSRQKSRDDVTSSMTATHVSQLSETTAVLRIDPLKREVPILPTAVRSEGRRVAVSAAPCTAPMELMGRDGTNSNKNASELIQRPLPLRAIPTTSAEEQQLRRLLRRCHSFSNLEADVLEGVVKAMEKEVHAAGTAILEQGQESSEKMYLVGEGTCEAIKNGKSMGPLQPGSTFGELELMYKQAKCAATIRCVTRCVLYSLDEGSYHRAVMTNSLQKRRKFENLTLNVPFLRCMPDFERMKIAEALVTREYRRGEAIIKFGAPGTYMHFVVEGEVKVVGRNNGRRVEVVRLHAGDVVGELEFLFNHLTVADVIATSHRVVTACISRDHFELIIGPIQDRLKEFVATSSTYESYYLSKVADASVRSELSRIESTRKHRRVASKENAVTLVDVNAHGEVLLSAPLALLNGKGKSNAAGSSYAATEPNSSGNNASGSAAVVLDEAARDTAQFPKALLRFPFSPITGKNVAVLAMREDGLIIYWNAVLERLTSYSAEEVIGQNIYSFLLAEREQHSMLKAITTAKNFAGDVGAFLERPTAKGNNFTLARSDGLTKATLQLTVVPPIVSAGNDAAEIVLGFGEEVKQGPHIMLEQPQWLSAQIRGILADGTQTFEERLECIAETLNNFESTYRAMTVSTERLRVVNVRQMVGHVLMDFGSEFVSRGVSVRQRFECLPSERAYLDADLLPECLRYAMKLCLKFSQVGGGVVTIMTTVTEKNGLEFLILNFNLAGSNLPEDIAKFLDTRFDQRGNSTDYDSSAGTEDEDDESNLGSYNNATPRRGLPPRLRRKLRRVQRAVEEQGGTLRIQRNTDDANIVFLIPFMPASDEDVENASIEESLHTLMESSSQSVSLSNTQGAAAAGVTATPNGTSLLPGDHNEDTGSVSALPTSGDESGLLNGSSGLNQPNFSFTTCLAEDTPAHRIMLSSFLWERRHAVLTAFKFDDVVKLLGVADILVIDLQQSVITSLNDDPINRLRELLRHMTIIITSTSFELVSSETCEAAGFITLKKPCTPVQAVKAIRRAEEKSAVVKLERIRIEQTRETLARNSRGAWRRGALLGKGSFGEVYEAYDVLTGGKMAVKEMRLGGNDARIEQFVQEISTMCNLQHPNIIHYFYCEESKEQKVIRVFMEFAGGGTLQSLLKKKGKLEFTELRALLRDVVEGLAYIHSQHYVHCDIKTANVLLSAEGKGKIGDFGTAHTVHDGELLYVMQGSPLYMSPECMSAGEEDEDGNRIGYSFPSDIWSLGCVAMEMVTTKPPFSHIKNMKGPAGLTNYITSLTDVPDLSPLFKSEPSIVEFVSACLNPDPTQRATAQDLLQMSLFSESTHSDRNSAIKALKRAQLLHVLNKFVAFQEPEEAVEVERRRSRFKVRRRSSDFFSSSSGSGRGSSSSSSSLDCSTTVTSCNLTGFSKGEKSVLLGKSKRVDGGTGSNASPNTAAVAANRWSDHNNSDSELPRRSETAAHVGENATHGKTSSSGEPSKADADETSAGNNTTTGSATVAEEETAAAVHTTKQRRSSSLEEEKVGTQFFRTLRKWRPSSSSTASSSFPSALSDHAEAQKIPEANTAPGGSSPATQAPTAMPSTESMPSAQATVAGIEGLHTPPRQNHCHQRQQFYHDPHTGNAAIDGLNAGAAVEDREPEPRMPISDDAYDLSPTPKKRSKTQSQPPELLREEKTRRSVGKPSALRKLRQRSGSGSSSSRDSNSTTSNEAAFFATSSDSSGEENSNGENGSNNNSRRSSTTSSTKDIHTAANRTVVTHSTTLKPSEGQVATVSTEEVKTAIPAAISKNNSSTKGNPLSIPPTQVSTGEHGTTSRQLSSNAADRGSTPIGTTGRTPQHMPTFAGRRRNVTMDDEGNIVTFQRFTSTDSGSVSGDSRNGGTGTGSSRGQPTQKLGAANAGGRAPLHNDVSPLGEAGGHRYHHRSSPTAPSPSTNYPFGSPGMVTVNNSATPAVTNTSFTQQPPNMSFFNYSFNKNISFMGANIDEVLHSAANDFLNSLSAANNNSNYVHSHAPDSSSIFSVDSQSAPSHATDRRGSTHGINHDGDGHTDNGIIFSSPLAPDTPTTAGSANGDTVGATAAAGGRRVSDSQCLLLSRSPSATLLTLDRNADNSAVGGASAESHDNTQHTSSNLSAPHTKFRLDSPPPQVPPLGGGMRLGVGNVARESHTSTNKTEASSSSPRGNSVPLVGANASMARRQPQTRPPITNQSFFVVEDLGMPTLSNASMALPSVSPVFSHGGLAAAATSLLSGHSATSAARVSATTMPNAAVGMTSACGSAGGESTASVLRHHRSVAVVAPPPLFFAFASTTAVRDAWKHRCRLGKNGSISGGRPAVSNSNENSRCNAPSHGDGANEHTDSDINVNDTGKKNNGTRENVGATDSVAAVEDSFYNDPAPSSAAFNSVRSTSSRQSSIRSGDDAPYLTTVRLQQIANQQPQNNSTDLRSAVFSTLTVHEESPLFTYLNRLNQSLIDVAAQLRTRRTRADSDPITSTMLEHAVSSDQIDSQQQQQQMQHFQPAVLSPTRRLHAAAAGRRLPSPILPLPFLPTSASLNATPIVENGPGPNVNENNATNTGSHKVTVTTTAGPRKGSGLSRTSLPRPVPLCPGSLATSIKATTQAAPPLRPQAGCSNPLRPADEDVNDRNANSGHRSTCVFTPAQLSNTPLSTPDSTTNTPRAPSSDTEDNSSGGKGNNAGGTGVEALLQKMLQRVNTLIEQVSRLTPQAPSHPGLATTTAAAPSSPLSVPPEVEGTA